MKIMLFLGSGVSLPSGLPDSSQLTHSILDDEWFNHTDGFYYPGQGPLPSKFNLVLRIQLFLKQLREYADEYYARKRWPQPANYEDLYYLARQIADEEQGEIFNPVVSEFVSNLKGLTAHLCVPLGHRGEEVTFEGLADRACDFIQRVVSGRLRNVELPIGMGLIEEIASSERVTQLDVFTLNHDLLIENLLGGNGLEFADGFGSSEEGVRYFEPSVYDRAQRIRVFKLHGSINWFRYTRFRGDFEDIDYAIPDQTDLWHNPDSKGRLRRPYGHSPQILAGTYNKVLGYGFGPAAEMHYRFHQALREHNLIVMSGYGWNDKAINTRIVEWLRGPRKKRLILYHKHPEDLRERSKSAMWHMFDKEVERQTLIPIRSWLCDASSGQFWDLIDS